GITLFFIITALMLWVVTAFDGITLPAEFSVSTVGFLIAAAALSCAANALWTIAVLRGNVALIGTLSYFTPVLSTAFSALLLSTALSFAFWQGVLMVTGGSLLCWLATRRK
ncbi:EamA family transporter, partial [Vibrio alginolyticus]|nr:EamA family transporter [Vibrio alginolyticus]